MIHAFIFATQRTANPPLVVNIDVLVEQDAPGGVDKSFITTVRPLKVSCIGSPLIPVRNLCRMRKDPTIGHFPILLESITERWPSNVYALKVSTLA